MQLTEQQTLHTLRPYLKSIILCFAILVNISRPAVAGQPVVDITYNPNLDALCSLFQTDEIKEEWQTELSARLEEFKDQWIAISPKLIATTEEITGKLFPEENFTAYLTLCNMPSQSILGISINMRYALKSFKQPAVPLRYKVDTLFHELLHEFLAEHPVQASELLKQHVSEAERTKNHLHLLALQKAVLLKLNASDVLHDVMAIDSQLPGGYYRRAWEIINASDTEYLKYIAEIRQ